MESGDGERKAEKERECEEKEREANYKKKLTSCNSSFSRKSAQTPLNLLSVLCCEESTVKQEKPPKQTKEEKKLKTAANNIVHVVPTTCN